MNHATINRKSVAPARNFCNWPRDWLARLGPRSRQDLMELACSADIAAQPTKISLNIGV